MSARPDPRTLPVTLWVRVRSVLLWTVSLMWLVPMMSLMMISAAIWPSDRTERLSRLYCWGQVWTTGSSWKAIVHPDVDDHTPYIFACNHVNLLDHVTMYNSTPHFKQGVELAAHFDVPVYGWFMRQRGTIAVQKGHRKQLERLQADVEAELALGHSILVFPEGTRTKDGRVAKFRKGFFRIARDAGVAVVPVSVTGMFGVLRKGSGVMCPGDVTVHVGAPIPTKDLSDADLKHLVTQAHAEVARPVDEYWEGSNV